MNTKKLTINGMSCGHCVMSLKKELSKMQGVTINMVSIGSAEVVVDESTVTDLFERGLFHPAPGSAFFEAAGIHPCLPILFHVISKL